MCVCVEDGGGCVHAWRMEEDGRQRKGGEGGKEEREERYDDGIYLIS